MLHSACQSCSLSSPLPSPLPCPSLTGPGHEPLAGRPLCPRGGGQSRAHPQHIHAGRARPVPGEHLPWLCCAALRCAVAVLCGGRGEAVSEGLLCPASHAMPTYHLLLANPIPPSTLPCSCWPPTVCGTLWATSRQPTLWRGALLLRCCCPAVAAVWAAGRQAHLQQAAGQQQGIIWEGPAPAVHRQVQHLLTTASLHVNHMLICTCAYTYALNRATPCNLPPHAQVQEPAGRARELCRGTDP